MNNTNAFALEDVDINIKFKLAALWTAATFCYLYGDYFELYTPDKLEGMINGDNILYSPLNLFLASLVMVIPPSMIVVSLMLKPIISKWLNIVFGSMFTIMMILIAIGSFVSWYSFYVFLALVEAMLTAIIVWKSFKWSKVSLTD